MYKAIIRPILFKADPEKIHGFVSSSLSFFGKFALTRRLLKSLYGYSHPMLRTEVAGMKFDNPMGIAAGFDKECRLIEIMPSLGFGHIEVGAITRNEQPGNEKPRIFRLPKDLALINRMGFNNMGADRAAGKLRAVKHKKLIVGLNIGKSKDTSLEEAYLDYLYTYEKLYDFADFMTINVSSPNTQGLRKLQDKSSLLKIIKTLQKANRKNKPLFVKVSPDLTWEELDEFVDVCMQTKISGVIAVNGTVSRKGLRTKINEAGGLSGRPLTRTATEFIRHIYKKTKGKLPIIGVGGVFTAEDAYEKIKAGASLVQVYTGFIYEGPMMAKNINRWIVGFLKRDGFRNVREAVGIDVSTE